jgi:hypothetical protein
MMQCQISAVPDLVIRFSKPIEISNSYTDQPVANGHHPASIATRYKRVA